MDPSSLHGAECVAVVAARLRLRLQNFEERVRLYYVPERVHLVAVGPLEIEPFVNLATRYFEPWVSIPHTLPDPVVVTEPRLIALPTGHPRVDLLLESVKV